MVPLPLLLLLLPHSLLLLHPLLPLPLPLLPPCPPALTAFVARPERSSRPSASMWAGAKEPSPFLRALRGSGVGVRGGGE